MEKQPEKPDNQDAALFLRKLLTHVSEKEISWRRVAGFLAIVCSPCIRDRQSLALVDADHPVCSHFFRLGDGHRLMLTAFLQENRDQYDCKPDQQTI